MRKVLVVFGTRPEAIKMAPVIAGLDASPSVAPVVAVSGQHRSMLDQVNRLFGIRPAYDLDIISPRQTLQDITTRVLHGVTDVIRSETPDLVLVQGDTTTAFSAALAAFYERTPVAHLEAGLRTENRYNPFPEETNRRITSQLADLHLAPTATSRANLLRDGIDPGAIVITGNTVIDALLDIVRRNVPVTNPLLAGLTGKRVVLVTAHRRESWNGPMARISAAVATLARSHPTVRFLLPAHLNPAVRNVLLPPLAGLHNVVITEPLPYDEMAWALNTSEIVLTDSGGIQEEAPSLGKPVLVMRDNTERPEAVNAGTVRLVGTSETRIAEQVTELLTNRCEYESMSRAVNPYGDGHAAVRCVQAIEHYFGLADRPSEFTPPAAGHLVGATPSTPGGRSRTQPGDRR